MTSADLTFLPGFTKIITQKVHTLQNDSGVPRSFVGGVQQIQLRTDDREKGDLGAVAP